MDDRSLDADDTDALFASPTAPAADRGGKGPQTPQPRSPTKQSNKNGQQANSHDSSGDEARSAALRRELAGVRAINSLMSGVVDTLERAGGNMKTVAKTVETASTLLNTWTRILSQTEHNQRLMLDPNWKGASQDLQDAENEALQRQLRAERRAAEEARRQAEAARRREEQESSRVAGASRPSTRGRGVTRGRTTRGTTRGTARVGTSSLGTDGDVSSVPSARAVSGIGRGRGFLRSGSRGARGA